MGSDEYRPGPGTILIGPVLGVGLEVLALWGLWGDGTQTVLASGLWPLSATGLHVAFAVSGLVGALFLWAGVQMLGTRVTVGRDGIGRKHLIAGRFDAAWEDVESWFIRITSPGAVRQRAVRLRRCGGRRDVSFPEAEVERPGFDAFVADLRAFAPDKETPDPRGLPTGPITDDAGRLQPDAAWRRAAAGLWLKAAALAPLGAAVALAVWAVVTHWRGQPWPADRLVAAAALFAVGVLLDMTGRVLCLSGPPQLGVGGFVRESVLIQVVGLLLLATSAAYAWSGSATPAAYTLAGAALAQFAAAVLFVNYLGGMARALGRADLVGRPLARLGDLGASLAELFAMAVGAVLGALILAIPLALLACVLMFCMCLVHYLLYYILYLVIYVGLGLGAVVGVALLVGGVGAVYFHYARAVLGLARQIGRRRAGR